MAGDGRGQVRTAGDECGRPGTARMMSHDSI